MTTQKSSKLGLGMLIGAITGAVAGLFLAQKPGKELQKDAQKLVKNVSKKVGMMKKDLAGKELDEIAQHIFGEVSDETRKIAKKVSTQVSAKIDMARDTMGKIDKKKYAGIVEDVVAELKKNGKVSPSHLKNLQKYLEADMKRFVSPKSKRIA